MSLSEVALDAWRQVLVENLPEVTLGGQTIRVTKTRGQGLRIVSFSYEGRMIDGIEQNPEKTSRWAELAREGKRILQFRCDRRFIGNVCEGTLLRYPAWKSLGLPE